MVAGALTQAIEAAWEWHVLERSVQGIDDSGMFLSEEIHEELLQLHTKVVKPNEAGKTMDEKTDEIIAYVVVASQRAQELAEVYRKLDAQVWLGRAIDIDLFRSIESITEDLQKKKETILTLCAYYPPKYEEVKKKAGRPKKARV